MADAGNGRPRRLSREVILDAGLRIVDEAGIEALTMRRLAADLQVNPMSIYHHLPGKAAVLAGLVERVYAQLRVDVPPDGTPWQDQVRAAAQAYRRILRAHPNLALQIISDPAAVAESLAVAGEPLYAALAQAGLPPRAVVDAANTVVDFVHGFLLGETRSGGEPFDLGPDLLERVAALPQGSAPTLTAVAEAVGADGFRFEYDRGFEVSLDILIRGIEAGLR
ncbi:MAG: TetR family transcriptional regulator [Streptosporangiales bacterium]|nr:TetR family transcriptional regulator [Streptosporangiales bacterium]